MKMKILAPGLLALACLGDAQAALLAEGFDDITTLAASGWVRTNSSTPVGNDWFQGNSGVFASQAGAPDSYIANSFLSTSSVSGVVDAWLISPELSLAGGATLTFYTRTADAGFLDKVEVRFSSGSSSDTASFATLLSTIDGATPYPTDWQAFSVVLPTAASGRFAFRYNVDNALDADFIGIDSVDVTAAVPEPSTYALFGIGMAALMLRRRASKRT
jgi:hypothetical protein